MVKNYKAKRVSTLTALLRVVKSPRVDGKCVNTPTFFRNPPQADFGGQSRGLSRGNFQGSPRPGRLTNHTVLCGSACVECECRVTSVAFRSVLARCACAVPLHGCRCGEETESPEPPAPRGSPEPPARRKSPVPPSVAKRRRLTRKTRPAEERQEIHEARKDHENIPAVVQKIVAEGHPDVFLNAHRRKQLLNDYAHWWRRKEKFHALSLREKRVVSAKYNLRSSHPNVLEPIFRDWAVARPAIANDINEFRKAVMKQREVGDRRSSE